MLIEQFVSLVACVTGSILMARSGFSRTNSCDRDIVLPIAVMLFLFYPILICLPEAHYKLVTFINLDLTGTPQNSEALFPTAFLISLLSITACVLFDQFVLSQQKNKASSLEHLLTLSIFLQNVVNFYFICRETNEFKLIREVILFGCFSLFVNFSYGYLLGTAGAGRGRSNALIFVMSGGLVGGFLLSCVIPPDVILLILPCCSAGIQIYCAIFIGFTQIFSDGESTIQDTFRYFSIFCAMLLTILYYPLCYFLRI